MPTPTREQFDKAMQAVLSSAPAGLSKEQFYGLIDKQLGMDQLKTANETPLKEPTTWLGGFLKGANDYATDLGKGMFEGAAHPQTAGDFLSLLMPTAVGTNPAVFKGLKAATGPLDEVVEPVGNRAIRFGARRAADALDLTPNIISNKTEERVVKGLRDFGEPRGPRVQGVEQFGPANKSGLPDGREMPQNISGAHIYSKDVPSTQTVRGSGIPTPTPYERPSIVDNSFASTSGYKPGEFGEPALPIEGSGVDPHMPNTSGYLPHEFGEGAGHIEGAGVDHHMPNSSGYTPGEFGESALPLEGSMGVDRYMPNKSGLSDLRMEELLDKFGGQGEEGAVVGPPADSGHPAAPETRSTYPTDLPEDWHSGAKPGSPEARRAQSQHKLFRELDNDYRRKLDDPLAALLMSLGAGAGAATLEKRQ